MTNFFLYVYRKQRSSNREVIYSSKKRKRSKKKKKRSSDSDTEVKPKVKRPRIKFGGLDDSEEEVVVRRTRGKKMTYVDTLGSDSEDVSFVTTVETKYFNVMFVGET